MKTKKNSLKSKKLNLSGVWVELPAGTVIHISGGLDKNEKDLPNRRVVLLEKATVQMGTDSYVGVDLGVAWNMWT